MEVGLMPFNPAKHSMCMASVKLGGRKGVLVQTPKIHRVFRSKFESSGDAVNFALSLRGVPELEALVQRLESEVQTQATTNI